MDNFINNKLLIKIFGKGFILADLLILGYGQVFNACQKAGLSNQDTDILTRKVSDLQVAYLRKVVRGSGTLPLNHALRGSDFYGSTKG